MGINDDIRDFVRRELLMDPDGVALDDDTPLLEEALIDSLGVFKLATFIEERFGIDVRDQDMVPEHFGTVRSLVRLVESRRAERRA